MFAPFSPYRLRSAAALLLALASATAHAGFGSDQVARYGKAGDALQFAVPLAGLGLTFLLPQDRGATAPGFQWSELYALDGSPRHDLGVAVLRAEVVTYALKYGVNERRPNGGSQSFPSGHTSLAFTGAEFIRKEYGWAWGTPAYLAAGFVGWTRVATRAHWAHDVYAGAAIGILSNHSLADFGLGGDSRLSVSVDSLAPAQNSDNRAIDVSRPVPGLRLEWTF